jgi:integrase/recombinase XerD
VAGKSVEYWLGKVERQLRKEGLTPGSIRRYLRVTRCFLLHLQKQKRELRSVTPFDLQRYLRAQWQRFKRRHRRPPLCDVGTWRSHHTGVIYRLLRLAQHQWPPPSPDELLLQEFTAYLSARGISTKVVRRYCLHAGFFLEYVRDRGLRVRCVTPDDVRAYFRVALQTSRRDRPGRTRSIRSWRNTTRWAVHGILRFVQGQWPPHPAPPASCLRFQKHLEDSGYCKQAIRHRVRVAQHFLVHLEKRGTPLSATGPADIANFVRTRLVRYRSRRGRVPSDLIGWRRNYTGAIHNFLRLTHPAWCSPPPPTDAAGQFRATVFEGYERWLVDVRGLAAATLQKNGREARTILSWLGAERSNRGSLRRLNVDDVDAYLAWRLPPLRRGSLHGICESFRSFLRYLHAVGSIDRDLGDEVKGPISYHNDEISRAFSQEQVAALLSVAASDRSPKGRRDYAMLLLLATYGVRAGEIVHLRLDDIDWRADRIRLLHSKTGVESYVPLLTPIGTALLQYLQKGRPQTFHR